MVTPSMVNFTSDMLGYTNFSLSVILVDLNKNRIPHMDFLRILTFSLIKVLVELQTAVFIRVTCSKLNDLLVENIFDACCARTILLTV